MRVPHLGLVMGLGTTDFVVSLFKGAVFVLVQSIVFELRSSCLVEQPGFVEHKYVIGKFTIASSSVGRGWKGRRAGCPLRPCVGRGLAVQSSFYVFHG